MVKTRLGIHNATIAGIGVFTAITSAIRPKNTKINASASPFAMCIPVPPLIFRELIQTAMITRINIENGLEVRFTNSN